MSKILELQLQHPMSIQGWLPLGLTGLISLLSKTHKRVLQHHNSKASIIRPSAFITVQISQLYVTTGKTISSVQSLSHVQLFATPWITASQSSLSITNSQGLPKPMSIESVMPFSHLIFCCPLLLLPPNLPSIRVFSNESTLCIRWPKYWSFSFNISPSNEHPGLISFRVDWLDLLAVQGTLNSLLQHHSSKASILWCSAFFTVQLSHPYMTTGKIIAWTIRTSVSRVMFLLFNTLSRFVIAFLPRSNLLILWLQSTTTVILEPKRENLSLPLSFPLLIGKK